MFDFKNFEDDFYAVQVSLRHRSPTRCRVLAGIYRKDVHEEVDCLVVSGNDQESALAELRNRLPRFLAPFERPPHHWGRVELRKLLTDYRKHNNELTSIAMRLKKLWESQGLTDEEMHSGHWTVREKAATGAIELTWRLAALTEQDRIDLMTASDQTYQNLANPWNLDDLDGRRALFGYMHNPSEAVVRAHQAHLARWGSASQAE
jgi:hypothetical protein